MTVKSRREKNATLWRMSCPYLTVKNLRITADLDLLLIWTVNQAIDWFVPPLEHWIGWIIGEQLGRMGKPGTAAGCCCRNRTRFLKRSPRILVLILPVDMLSAMVFLGHGAERLKKVKAVFDEELAKETLSTAGWREVPVDVSVLGRIAEESLPAIYQVYVNGTVRLGTSRF